MFDRLMAFLRDLPGDGGEPTIKRTDDPRIAAAALMFHVIDADGVRSESEKERLESVLKASYGLSGKDLKAILRAGEEAEKEAVDLYAFTSVLKRHLDLGARIDFIRIMWEIVYADGVRHELEDNLVWRIAELIGVERGDRVAMRRFVEGKADGGDNL